MITFLVVASVSYFIGAFPAGYFAGRLAGIDIRTQGSGNIGATNVTRVLGKRYGYAVFLFDFLKGLAAVILASAIVKHRAIPTESLQFLKLLAAAFCVLGHSFPVWLRFRGGKGVATSAGALFGMMPVAGLIVIVVWIVTFQVTRYVSVASMTAALAVPITVAIVMHVKGTDDRVFLYFSLLVAVVIILRHRSNISRLISGTESRFRKGENG